jgi:hypothetical protein
MSETQTYEPVPMPDTKPGKTLMPGEILVLNERMEFYSPPRFRFVALYVDWQTRTIMVDLVAGMPTWKTRREFWWGLDIFIGRVPLVKTALAAAVVLGAALGVVIGRLVG